MSSCVVARTSSPCTEDLELMDLVQPMQNDNSLPLISTTTGMPAVIKTTDRPVVLYMAPVHKNSQDDSTGDEMCKSVEKVNLKG